MEALKPCPFCGGAAKMKKGFPGRQNGQKQAVVQCRVCGCRTVTFRQLATESVEDLYRHAVETWNRRAEQAGPQVVRCRDCAKRNTDDCAMWYQCSECYSQHSWESDNDFLQLGCTEVNAA